MMQKRLVRIQQKSKILDIWYIRYRAKAFRGKGFRHADINFPFISSNAFSSREPNKRHFFFNNANNNLNDAMLRSPSILCTNE